MSIFDKLKGLSPRDHKMTGLAPEKSAAPVAGETSQRRFEPGEQVKVRRSDGQIDTGWQVVREVNGRAIVAKLAEGDQLLQKSVKIEELTALNPREKDTTEVAA